MRKRYYVLFFAMMAVYLSCTTTAPVQPTVPETAAKGSTSTTASLTTSQVTTQISSALVPVNKAVKDIQTKSKADSLVMVKKITDQGVTIAATSKTLKATQDSLTALKTSVTGLIKTIDLNTMSVNNGVLTIPLIPVLQNDVIKIKAILKIP